MRWEVCPRVPTDYTLPSTETYYTLPFLNWTSCDLNGFGPPFQQVYVRVLRSLLASRCQLEMLQWFQGLKKFPFHEPGVFIQRLDSIFAKKNLAGLVSIGAATLPSVSYLATILCRKDEADYHRFLFPISNKFPDLNFAPYVLYIYSCYETRT